MLLELLHISRSLRRSPLSAGAAIVTLALTLAVSASIFAVVDAVLLTPLPFTEPDSLVVVGEAALEEPTASVRTVPHATFVAWRQRSEGLATLEAFDGTNLTLTGVGSAERIRGTDITPGLLSLLGVVAARGRAFTAEDLGQPVAIVSDAFWRGTLAADPAVLGRHIVLGGRAHEIVGVLPGWFTFGLSPGDVWRPLPMTPAQASRTGYRVTVIGRLANGVSADRLATGLDRVSRTSLPPARALATPIASAVAGTAATTLPLLAGAAAIAILVAWANLAGLVILRSIDRRRELAIRNALGAGRFEAAHQLLLEALAIVALGTSVGIVLACWTTPLAGRLALEQFGSVTNRDVAMNWRMTGVIAIIALISGCASGLLPALTASRSNIVDVLRRGATPATREIAVRRLFVGAEVALAFVLLVSMTLVGRALFAALAVDPGFRSRDVLALQVSLPVAVYPTREGAVSFYAALHAALQERLGAGTVSFVDELPLTGSRGRSLVSLRSADLGREAVVRTAGPEYFDVMQIPLAAGRAFAREDNALATPRVVISTSLAERLFGGAQPIGGRIWIAALAQMAEVIGVVGDVKHRSLDEAFLPTVYLSALQAPSPSSILVTRTSVPQTDAIAAVREEVARLDGNLPVYGVRAMASVVAASPGVTVRRLLTTTFSGFAVLALALSAVGLFGVAAHDVACRRSELALRVALGADPRRVLRATLGREGVVVVLGLVTGAILSLWAARGLSSVLRSTGGIDFLGVGLAATLLLITAAAAVLPAALRAARTDPLIALRSE